MTDAPPAASVDEAVIEACSILDEVLWDEEPWSGKDLVDAMERVYVALGGCLDGPPEAKS